MKDRVVSYQGDEYGCRDIHNNMLPVFDMLNSHCEHYGITYSLAFGSMLGCVRSHGFIPWDDDVDIVLKREDYDRFIESFESKDTELSKFCHIESPRFLTKVVFNSPEYSSTSIDVFAVDRVPNNRFYERTKLVAIKVFRDVIIGRSVPKNTAYRISIKVLSYLISFPFSLQWLRKKYSKACACWKEMPSNRYCCYSTTSASYGKYHSIDEFDGVEFMDFEDIKMPVMTGYHSYLVREFGEDYMTLPKIEDRHPIHNTQRS